MAEQNTQQYSWIPDFTWSSAYTQVPIWDPTFTKSCPREIRGQRCGSRRICEVEAEFAHNTVAIEEWIQSLPIQDGVHPLYTNRTAGVTDFMAAWRGQTIREVDVMIDDLTNNFCNLNESARIRRMHGVTCKSMCRQCFQQGGSFDEVSQKMLRQLEERHGLQRQHGFLGQFCGQYGSWRGNTSVAPEQLQRRGQRSAEVKQQEDAWLGTLANERSMEQLGDTAKTQQESAPKSHQQDVPAVTPSGQHATANAARKITFQDLLAEDTVYQPRRSHIDAFSAALSAGSAVTTKSADKQYVRDEQRPGDKKETFGALVARMFPSVPTSIPPPDRTRQKPVAQTEQNAQTAAPGDCATVGLQIQRPLKRKDSERSPGGFNLVGINAEDERDEMKKRELRRIEKVMRAMKIQTLAAREPLSRKFEQKEIEVELDELAKMFGLKKVEGHETIRRLEDSGKCRKQSAESEGKKTDRRLPGLGYVSLPFKEPGLKPMEKEEKVVEGSFSQEAEDKEEEGERGHADDREALDQWEVVPGQEPLALREDIGKDEDEGWNFVD